MIDDRDFDCLAARKLGPKSIEVLNGLEVKKSSLIREQLLFAQNHEASKLPQDI
jgi:hypothetical protein